MKKAILKFIEKTIAEKGKVLIVFYGDSITSYENRRPNWTDIVEYVLKNRLKSYWELKFINSSLNGADSGALLEHLDSDVLRYKPDLLMAMFGKNDKHRGVDPEKHKNNLRGFIGKSLAEVPFTVFITPNSTAKAKQDKDYENT